ncbi:uncharacterized protein DUF4202 [Algoriphagus ratkowskyi]|uniref:DUF4202 domain-containing protein n=1 Tax=Algoriphagus ratkowskyi TaxID=57028 RepID=A0A2W7R1R4_9BACT|nr:DUF4202 domain-containing protein [Algoriphagus ratkowskyi]PZX54708.1 uncharacterized protein DUF4202 [Algoriphagus ratkowskyi]TXD77017.1 DUF4202 domain-containing protein [Algoriphagus ratkowskyi]
MNKFHQAISLIDQVNAEDPIKELVAGKEIAKELLYSIRMTDKLHQFDPEASEAVQLAIRAQHIGRWKIPRSNYPMDRVGYLKWREELKIMHADKAEEILVEAGFEKETIEKTKFLIRKKQLKTDPETQTVEDVICLVFLEYYFEEFSAKHEPAKIIDILKKTWGKMSEKGHRAALKLPLSASSLKLIEEAIFS